MSAKNDRASDHREPPRLVEIGGDLSQELVVAEPDRDGDEQFVLHPSRQPRTTIEPSQS